MLQVVAQAGAAEVGVQVDLDSAVVAETEEDWVGMGTVGETGVADMAEEGKEEGRVAGLEEETVAD